MKTLLKTSIQWYTFIFYLAKIVIIHVDCNEKIYSDGITNLKTAIQNLVRTTATHDVFIISDMTTINEWTRTISSAIMDSVAGIFPTQFVTVEQLDSMTFRPQQLATSRTLVIQFITPHSDYETVISKISARGELPKLLIITMFPEPVVAYRELFNNIFRKLKILDSTIIEVQRYEEGNVSVVVHRYNPFNGSYTREPLKEQLIDLFPNKLQNLHGYKLEITPGVGCDFGNYLKSKFEQQGKYVETLYAFRDIMNVTIQKVEVMHSDLHCGDFIPYNYAVYDYTVVTDTIQLCLFIPRISLKTLGISFWGIVGTFIVGVTIVLLFWVVSKFMKVDERLRHPINTVSLILGVSIPREPQRFVEKILFLFLVIASTRYTAMLYTELYNLGIIEERELNIVSFEDLEQSGLSCLILQEDFDFMAEDIPDALKQRMHGYDGMEENFWPTFFSSNKSLFLQGLRHDLIPIASISQGKMRVKK